MPLWLAALLMAAGVACFAEGVHLREADRPIRYTLEWGFLTNSRPLGKVLGIVGASLVLVTALLLARDLLDS